MTRFRFFAFFREYPLIPFLVALLIPIFGLTSIVSTWAEEEEEEQEVALDEKIIKLSPFAVANGAVGYTATRSLAASSMSYGATPGGAQDIRYFRMAAGDGSIPHPNTITAEGLFSEHDLPLRGDGGCQELLCVEGAAMETSLALLPEADYLVQVGFTSGLDPRVWRRAPLNLIAVVDKSGSMIGQPLKLVKTSLRQVVSQLEETDQLSIVLYGDQAHVHLSPTAMDREGKARASKLIKEIESMGSTFMEAGLRVGLDLAEESGESFEGTTRLMLFTDERPNVGATDAGSFMDLARRASKRGVGMTTVGVGVQFGAELATKISSVRGGNLFFFPDANEMVGVFTEEFDTMVTELAYDFSLVMIPGSGLRIAGVYGIPRDQLRWEDGRAISLSIKTIFLSKRKGAIYFALAREDPGDLPREGGMPGDRLAVCDLQYTPVDGDAAVELATGIALMEGVEVGSGLNRGEYLINEYSMLKRAATLHLVENDQEGAYRMVDRLRSLSPRNDPDLEIEYELVDKMYATLALLSGHAGEARSVSLSMPHEQLFWGAWNVEKDTGSGEFKRVVFWPGGGIHGLVKRKGNWLVVEEWVLEFDGDVMSINEERARYKFPGDDRLHLSWNGRRMKLIRGEMPELDQEFPDEEVVVNPITGLPDKPGAP